MQELSETGRKEEGESRGFYILWMRIIEDVFQIKGKNPKTKKDWKCVGENSCQSEESAFVWNR